MLLREVKVDVQASVKMLSDNQASINIAKNPSNHYWTKHCEIDRHFISKMVDTQLYFNQIVDCWCSY